MQHSEMAGDGLVSIVVPCCNALESTRACVKSVLRWTRPRYELLLVDNGSTDDTPAYLAEAAAWAGPARVAVIRNEANAGYAAACNQALAVAQGRNVVLLDNDTIVSEDWLDRLIAWSRYDWPNVGLVGAVSNRAARPQQVEASYLDVSELDTITSARRREFAGQALRVKRLSGFCLLIRREVLDQVGGFDERFGLGYYADDDLCLRARDAGFRLLVAARRLRSSSGRPRLRELGDRLRPAVARMLRDLSRKMGAGANWRLLIARARRGAAFPSQGFALLDRPE